MISKDLNDAATTAQTTLTACLARLKVLRPGALGNDLAIITAQIAETQANLTVTQMVIANLTNAIPLVSPLDPQKEQEILSLAKKLDAQILQDAWGNATLAVVTTAVTDGTAPPWFATGRVRDA